MIEVLKSKYQKSRLHIKIQNFGLQPTYHPPTFGRHLWIVILIFGFWILNFNCYAQPVSSNDLINNAREYNNKNVAFMGEVVGDVMVRGEYAWINVYDGRNAIGVWIGKDWVKDVHYTAGYKSTGDIIEVAGIFHRACPQHGGDLDIHALAFKKIKEGYAVKEDENILKRNLALILLGGLCMVLILRRLKVK